MVDADDRIGSSLSSLKSDSSEFANDAKSVLVVAVLVLNTRQDDDETEEAQECLGRKAVVEPLGVRYASVDSRIAAANKIAKFMDLFFCIFSFGSVSVSCDCW